MSSLRRLPKFEYLAPVTIDEVCRLLAAHASEAKLFAGGTDLLLQMRRRETVPAYIIGLKGVPELSFVREPADGGLAIGAMTTIQTLLTSPIMRKKYSVLAEAAAGIGGPELRNVATIGGNLAGALPCADFPPALIALGAKAKLKSRARGTNGAGRRIVPEVRQDRRSAGRAVDGNSVAQRARFQRRGLFEIPRPSFDGHDDCGGQRIRDVGRGEPGFPRRQDRLGEQRAGSDAREEGGSGLARARAARKTRSRRRRSLFAKRPIRAVPGGPPGNSVSSF